MATTETNVPEAKTEAGGNKRPPRGTATVAAAPGPRKRPIVGRSALRIQPEQTTRPDREF